MKIISKYKDYYDYLIGKYGIDPKIVLDRTKHHQPDLLFPRKIVLHICDKKYEGFFDGVSFYYGEKLGEIGELRTTYGWGLHESRDQYWIKYQSYGEKWEWTAINPRVVNTDWNQKEDCPILLGDKMVACEYPKLSDLGIASILPAEEIYQMLVQWLSERNQKKENIIDNRNDVQKLESKGFDKVISFRPNIKSI